MLPLPRSLDGAFSQDYDSCDIMVKKSLNALLEPNGAFSKAPWDPSKCESNFLSSIFKLNILVLTYFFCMVHILFNQKFG